MRKSLYSISLCLILFTPFLYSNELYNGVISAKQLWFYGAMALLMMITAIDRLFDRKPFVIQFNRIDLALLAFYSYYTIRAATTPYMPLLHNQRWINWTLCVVLYFIIKRTFYNEGMKNEELKMKNNGDNQNSLVQPQRPILNSSFFILNFLILTGLAQAIWGLLQLYDYLPSFNGYYKITGTFFNPAPYAMYLAVIFPIALGQIIRNERIKNEELRMGIILESGNKIVSYIKYPFQFLIINSLFLIYYFSFFTVIAIILVLPATMIRAAWLAAAVGALVVAWPWLTQHTPIGSFIMVFGTNRKYKVTTIIVTLILIGAIGSGLFYLKKDSANGKLFIWEVTLGKIAEKPLFGYGVGRFEAEYNNWQAEYFQKHPAEMDGPKGWVAGNTKYTFNEVLEMTSETGIVGILLFGGMLILALGKLRMKNKIAFHSSFFILSFLILLFLSFPFYNLPLLLAFIVVLAVISSDTRTIVIQYKPPIITTYAYATVLLAICMWFGLSLPKNYKAFRTWHDANFIYNSNVYESSIKEYEKVYMKFNYNNEFLQQYGKSLAMNKDFTKAKIILNEAGKYGGDYMLYANLGDVYKELKQYPLAEAAYLHSACMVPHKLYPHYLLAKLYVQSGDTIKAISKAEVVLTKNAKVNNMAEEEIKKEMKNLIKKEAFH